MLAVAAGPAPAQLFAPQGILEPEKAFRISARALDEHHVEVEFRIAEGYYLYRDRFSFATESGKPLAEVEIPRGKLKEDQFLGKSETFRDLVRIRVAVSAGDAAPGDDETQSHLARLLRSRPVLPAARTDRAGRSAAALIF